MNFGIHSPSWRFGDDPHGAFEAVRAKARWAEAHAFTWFSVMDHLIQIPWVGAPDEPFMESWTVLSALAAVTSRIRLATLVSSAAYRNPAHLAKMAATVDVISRGRLTLGIGAGWYDEEYRQYGWDFPPRPAVRIRQVEEAVRLIRAMWADKRATFHGEWFHVQDAMLEPKPVQHHPPILIGGGERLTLRAVARLADACNIPADPETAQRKHELLRRHCEREGRAYDEIERTALVSVLLARDERSLAAKRDRLAGRGPFRAFAGTVGQAMDLVGRYREAGVQLLICSIYRNDAETQELLASDIVPRV